MVEIIRQHLASTGGKIWASTGGHITFVSATPFEPSAFTAPALWQHGFEPSPHPFKVTAQLGDNGTVREVGTVHVVGYEGYSKPSPGGVLGTDEKPKTKGANCERRHPGGNGIAAQSTEEPGGHRSHKPDASDQNRIVSHSALRSIPILPNDRGTALTSR